MTNTKVLVHINEELNRAHRENLSQKVCKLVGVKSADLIDHCPHLMIVGYNPGKTKSLQVLNGVKNNGIHAQLISWL